MTVRDPALLVIAPEHVETMAAHARTWYPGECCGLLITGADDSVVRRVICMDNLQDTYHERFPEDFPRTSRDGFKLDERAYARIDADARAAGERVLAIFHSHIDCGAYFSDEDKAMAAPFGEPNQPELCHVVLDCQPGPTVVGAKAFRWDGSDFAEHRLPDFAH
ncbi:MAG: Mov34/MPN/PAD-1 family protein [Planctomycetota bacterium]